MIDFNSTTLEHIYPQRPPKKEKSPEMDSVVNDIGNLTIIDSPGNSFLRNKSFAEKKTALQESKITLNQEIGRNKKWTIKEVTNRQNMLIGRALEVFKLT